MASTFTVSLDFPLCKQSGASTEGLRKGSESPETRRRVSWPKLGAKSMKLYFWQVDYFSPRNRGKSPMLSARHPGLVPFLGAWSTQHFTLDKQEFKALALLVINPFPCAFAARLTSWESSCAIRILKKCFFSARKRRWHARSLGILWCDKPRRMGWDKSTLYPYHRKTSFKQRMLILVPKVQWPNVASTRDCKGWHVKDGLGRCDIFALSNKPLSSRHTSISGTRKCTWWAVLFGPSTSICKKRHMHKGHI